MKTFEFKTYFGNVTGHIGSDFCEFESNECIIIGMDADSDGPQWEDDSQDWATLNDLCHRIKDNNLYGVADGYEKRIIIDSTDSYLEMNTWKAWVTNSPDLLYYATEKELLDELFYIVNKEMYESISDPKLETSDVLKWSLEIFEQMKDTGEDFLDAFELVAKSKGYEI